MTTSTTINGGTVIVWPENTLDDQFSMEHAIAVIPYSESIAIEQNGHSINVPLYAFSALQKALRQAAASAREKS